MTDTLVHEQKGASASPPRLFERPDASFRSAFDVVPVLSLDGRRSTWVGRFGKSAFGIAGPLSLRGRAAQANINDARTISVSEMRHGPSRYATEAERRRRAAAWAASGGALLLLVLGAVPLGRASAGNTPRPAVLGRQSSSGSTATPTEGGPGLELSTAPTPSPVPPTSAQGTADRTPTDGTPTDGTPTDGGPGDPSHRNPTLRPVDPQPPTLGSPPPAVQVLVAALAGVDVGLAVGLGDNACVGLRISTVIVGCSPGPREELGVTGEVRASFLPEPIVLSVP
jgi:hypothetical protein